MAKKSKKSFWNFPSLKQWGELFNVFNKKERIFFSLLFLFFILSGLIIQIDFYRENTTVVPEFGGKYREGLISQPKFINPLYLSNNDSDRDLVELIFSGLLKYNEKGEIVKDLAESYEIKNEGKEYEFQLKNNIFWHDGTEFSVEDILFNLEIIGSPQYNSPLRIQLLGVRFEKKEGRKIVFRLQKANSSFLETIAQLKFLPKHIFQNIPAGDLPWTSLSQENLIGTGPFEVKKIKKNNSGFTEKIALERNENYYAKKPFLEEIFFHFYENFDQCLKAARTGEIDGFTIPNPKYLTILEKEGFKSYHLKIPRYFGLFFNLREDKFQSKEIRKGLALALAKEEILKEVFFGQGETISSPVLNEYYQISGEKEISFNPQKAEEILEAAGFKKNPQTGLREKEVPKDVPSIFTRDLNQGEEGNQVRKLQECLAQFSDIYPEGVISGYFGPKTKSAVIRFQEKYAQEVLHPIGLSRGTGKAGPMTREKLDLICQEVPSEKVILSFSLTTGESFPLKEMAEKIKEQLEEIGVAVQIKTVSLSELQTKVFPKRDFEMLLFGEALGQIPDPLSFWHSSQKKYPGLNITGYDSRESDKLLEEIRKTLDPEERKEKLKEFQDVIREDQPAVFLIRNNLLYSLPRDMGGFKVEKISNPAKRFTTIENWFIKRKRVWQ